MVRSIMRVDRLVEPCSQPIGRELIARLTARREVSGLFEGLDGVEHVTGVREDRRVLAPHGVVGIRQTRAQSRHL